MAKQGHYDVPKKRGKLYPVSSPTTNRHNTLATSFGKITFAPGSSDKYRDNYDRVFGVKDE